MIHFWHTHTGLSQSEESKCMWTHCKDVVTWCHLTVYSHTFTFFWLRKISVSVETSQLSFCVFICAFHLEISSLLWWEFPVFIPIFVLSILQYFPFLYLFTYTHTFAKKCICIFRTYIFSQFLLWLTSIALFINLA